MPENYLEYKASSAFRSRSWHGAAFIVETLLLVIFLVASVAIVVNLLGKSYAQGLDAEERSRAILLASDDAESFAANPTSLSSCSYYMDVDGSLQLVATGVSQSANVSTIMYEGQSIPITDSRVYVLRRNVETSVEKSGNMMYANIEVSCRGRVVYELNTSRYVSRGGEA